MKFPDSAEIHSNFRFLNIFAFFRRNLSGIAGIPEGNRCVLQKCPECCKNCQRVGRKTRRRLRHARCREARAGRPSKGDRSLEAEARNARSAYFLHAAVGRRRPIGKISANCCSFSAVSAPIYARKYAFFSIFQNLQDYLAEIFENWQNLLIFQSDFLLKF